MSDQGVLLYRVRGLVDGANWRVTKFAQAVPHHLTCGLCNLISRTTFLLPCLHTLCESCVSHSVHDGNTVCPFDEEAFAVGDCQKFQLPPATADKLKACCWNEAQGCTFVGTLQAVLTHYEQECTFHAVTCPRCNGHVLQQDLPSHYRTGCHGDTIAASAGEPISSQRMVVSVEDIGTCLDELKALIRDNYQDRVPELQSKMNDVLEEARDSGTKIEEITRYGREAEQRLTQALGELSRTFSQELQSQQYSRTHDILEQVTSNGMRIDAISRTLSASERSTSHQIAEATQKLSATFGRELQSQQAVVCADLRKHLEIREISLQAVYHGQRIEAIAKTLHDSELRLSQQIAEAVDQLSTTFAKKLEPQQRELCAELETQHPSHAGATSVNEMPWRLEKRHILRKLELMVNDSHAYLELLRTGAYQLKVPLVEYRPVLPCCVPGLVVMPAPMGKRECEYEGYTVRLTNIDDVVKSQKFIYLFTQWYRRDRYLQMAAYGWSNGLEQGLEICLKWGTTLNGSCSTFPEAEMRIIHPEVLKPKKLTAVSQLAELFGFQETFVVNLSELERLGILTVGALTMFVYFKV